MDEAGVAEEDASLPPPLPQPPSAQPLESTPPAPLPLEEAEAPRHPISMRVILSSHALPSGVCILQEVHYASAPSSIGRIYKDVQHIFSQHGFREIDVACGQGVLRVTSGREAPGVQILGPGRVVLFSPVVWEFEARGDCDDDADDGVFREKVAEAARIGDWLVFVLALPGCAPLVGGGLTRNHGAASAFGGLDLRDRTPLRHESEVVDIYNGGAVTTRDLNAPPPPPPPPGEQPAASVHGGDAASRHSSPHQGRSVHESGTIAGVGSPSQGDGNPDCGSGSQMAPHANGSLIVTSPLPAPSAQAAPASIRSGSLYLNGHASGASPPPSPPAPSQASSVGGRGSVRSDKRTLSVRSASPVVSRAARGNNE